MNPGELRHRVQVWGKLEGKNALKETTQEDIIIDTVWANIIPQTGKLQNQQVNTILTNVTHKIIIRHNRKIAEAYQDELTKKTIFVLFKGHRFDVRYILNPYFKNTQLEMFVEEVIG